VTIEFKKKAVSAILIRNVCAKKMGALGLTIPKGNKVGRNAFHPVPMAVEPTLAGFTVQSFQLCCTLQKDHQIIDVNQTCNVGNMLFYMNH
jgi:hypothetical protein